MRARRGPEKDTGEKRCHCLKSQCLKLYCDCFANGQYCHGCQCTDCQNVEANAALIAIKRSEIKEKNPEAFQKKSKACNCKRSQCLKMYCECFKAGLPCRDSCKCKDCHNLEADMKSRLHTTKVAAAAVGDDTLQSEQRSPFQPNVPFDIPPAAPVAAVSAEPVACMASVAGAYGREQAVQDIATDTGVCQAGGLVAESMHTSSGAVPAQSSGLRASSSDDAPPFVPPAFVRQASDWSRSSVHAKRILEAPCAHATGALLPGCLPSVWGKSKPRTGQRFKRCNSKDQHTLDGQPGSFTMHPGAPGSGMFATSGSDYDSGEVGSDMHSRPRTPDLALLALSDPGTGNARKSSLAGGLHARDPFGARSGPQTGHVNGSLSSTPFQLPWDADVGSVFNSPAAGTVMHTGDLGVKEGSGSPGRQSGCDGDKELVENGYVGGQTPEASLLQAVGKHQESLLSPLTKALCLEGLGTLPSALESPSPSRALFNFSAFTPTADSLLDHDNLLGKRSVGLDWSMTPRTIKLLRPDDSPLHSSIIPSLFTPKQSQLLDMHLDLHMHSATMTPIFSLADSGCATPGLVRDPDAPAIGGDRDGPQPPRSRRQLNFHSAAAAPDEEQPAAITGSACEPQTPHTKGAMDEQSRFNESLKWQALQYMRSI